LSQLDIKAYQKEPKALEWKLLEKSKKETY